MRIIKRLQALQAEKKLDMPPWLLKNAMYLTITGSQAYQITTESSDLDISGFAIEPRECITPSTYGYIPGFDNIPAFDVWQKHHIQDVDSNRVYDISIYGLVNFFRLLTDGNPNIVETLFTERDCVLLSTDIAEKIRNKRSIFLSKNFAFKCRMYAHSQLSKLDREPEGKRRATVEKYGWDTKYQSHIYRLILQSEQVLTTGELFLPKYAELLKSVRRGEISPDETRKWFSNKERELEKLEKESNLPQKPNRAACKELLVECLNYHYENLFEVKPSVKLSTSSLEKLKEVLQELL